MSATAIVVAALGGGAVGTIVSQALAIQNERSVRIRNAKIEALKAVLEANETARAALTDFRHALEDWERLVEQGAGVSSEKTADLPEAQQLARTADEASEAAHAAMRISRRRSAEMMMMFAPKTGLQRPIRDVRHTFRHLRSDLIQIRKAIEVTPAQDTGRAALWDRVEEHRKARRAAEQALIDRVHPALWPWWHRRSLRSLLTMSKTRANSEL